MAKPRVLLEGRFYDPRPPRRDPPVRPRLGTDTSTAQPPLRMAAANDDRKGRPDDLLTMRYRVGLDGAGQLRGKQPRNQTMSLIDSARYELILAKWDPDDIAAMTEILEKFFDQWDSGGAVHAVAPVLQRLIAGKPLSPLTGDDDEWTEVVTGVFQNRRLSSVFKDPRFHDGKQAYDLDNPKGARAAISFPYYPDRAEVRSPVVEM